MALGERNEMDFVLFLITNTPPIFHSQCGSCIAQSDALSVERKLYRILGLFLYSSASRFFNSTIEAFKT